MPVITLEVISDPSNPDHYTPPDNNEVKTTITDSTTDPAHFEETQKPDENERKDPLKVRNDLLEYLMRDDGSVICKLCGEVLQSRTHWYRHKYKVHVIQPLNPAPLFQCEQCLVYFKSRKGYIGHLASRHSDILSDTTPVLTNAQAEEGAQESEAQEPDIKEEPDPELSIPKSSVLNYQTNNTKQTATKSTETRKYRTNKVEMLCSKAEWEAKRSREEKLVADIIDRVRKECEAQAGTGGPARRGYTRRTTVMNTT